MSTIDHISELFAESVHVRYKKKRYGIKSCNMTVDPDYASDLRELLLRSQELDKCKLTLGGCGLTAIEEKIKTL